MTIESEEKVAYEAFPLGFCAGVEWSYKNALDALSSDTAPVYGVGTIVNNFLVVQDLERKGMVFVEKPEEVPRGVVAVISAHGLSQSDREILRSQEPLKIVDSTCPLVQVVHERVLRALDLARTQGKEARILYITKLKDLENGHKEVRGIISEAPNNVIPMTNQEQVDEFVPDPDMMYFVDTQTTLNIDHANAWIQILKKKIPELIVPPSGDVCYATKNRQSALKLGLSKQPDLMIAFGSTISSNTGELVRMGKEYGVNVVQLLETADLVTPELVENSKKILVTAGASAPPREPDKCLEILASWGFRIEELRVATEPQYFDRKPNVEILS